jgi:hypothetical protein
MRDFEYEVTPMVDGHPTVTLGDVERAIVAMKCFVEGTTTVCVVTLDNGHTVVGTSACVVPAKYNVAIGEDIAFKNAQEKVWALLGYELRLKLAL